MGMLEEYKGKVGLMKVIENRDNVGLNVKLKRGWMGGSGEVIGICEEEDVWMGEKMEKEVEGIGD